LTKSNTSSRKAESMLYAALAIPAILSSNGAELTTGNVRSGASIDNLKASWGKALSIGKFKANIDAKYDYASSKDSLKEVSLSGDLVEGGGDDLSVSYQVKRNFASGNNDIKLTASSGGTDLKLGYANGEVKDISATRDVDIGDYKVSCEPSWTVKAKAARVKLMTSLGSKKDSFGAEVEYTDGDARVNEVSYSRDLDNAKSVSAKLEPESKDLEIEYTDGQFEDGATWKAVVNTKAEGNLVDAAKVTLSRAWNW